MQPTVGVSIGCGRPHPNLLSPGPYSQFRVGACILTASGEFVVGANVENVSYPVGTCAERVALGTAIVEILDPLEDHG